MCVYVWGCVYMSKVSRPNPGQPHTTAWFLCVLLSAGSQEQIVLGGASWSASDQTQGISYSYEGAGSSGDPCWSSVASLLVFSSVYMPCKLGPAQSHLCKSQLAQRGSQTLCSRQPNTPRSQNCLPSHGDSAESDLPLLYNSAIVFSLVINIFSQISLQMHLKWLCAYLFLRNCGFP